MGTADGGEELRLALPNKESQNKSGRWNQYLE